MEPGEAMRAALLCEHPFAVPPRVPQDLRACIDEVSRDPQAVMRQRSAIRAHWRHQAEQLKSSSLDRLQSISDPHLRSLYLRGTDVG
eukprot:4834899-Amphidinium_carterae.1